MDNKQTEVEEGNLLYIADLFLFFQVDIGPGGEALLDLKCLTDTVLNEEENAEYNLKSYINSLLI